MQARAWKRVITASNPCRQAFINRKPRQKRLSELFWR